MKTNDQVIQEFNQLVNMTAPELETWLKSDDSNSASWPKEDENGETVGHDSGRRIVEILKGNPDKEPGKYTDEQVEHMRKVVSYCKRHLAQESKTNSEKSPEEVKKTKSYASLKNWGHDFLKARDEKDGRVEDEGGEEKEKDEEQTGDKRKTTGSQSGSNKKRETRKGESKENEDEEDNDEDDEEKQANGKEQQSNGKATNGKAKNEKKGDDEDEDDDTTPKKGPKKRETVSWNWGQGQPEGKVLDVKAEETSITTKKGNTVSRKGDAEDPAVVLDTGKSKAIKKNHELNG
ncbi:hypothetical protein ACJZ2D_016398 [Fusarium nematophilum]